MGRKDRRAKYMFQGSLEKFLTKKELWRKPIAKDGSCLFRAVAEQVSSWEPCWWPLGCACQDKTGYNKQGKVPLSFLDDDNCMGCRLTLGGQVTILPPPPPPQVFMTQERHSKVRLECAEHIRTHQDDFKEVGRCIDRQSMVEVA